jgi:outer membrane immunogenic protein
MKRVKASLLFAGLASIGLATAASAADLPAKAPVYKAPPIVVSNWTGWYAGVHAGWVGQRNCNALTAQGLWPAFPVDADLIQAIGTGCADSSGFIGGAQVGANYQMGGWLWGIEADISALTAKTTRRSSGFFADSLSTTVMVESARTSWLSTFRARTGMLVGDNTLVYVTGGLAVAQVKADVDSNGFEQTGAPRFHATGSVTQVTPGWTIGAGAETRIGGNWSVRAEYLYVALDPVNYNTTYDLVNGVNVWGNFNENIAVTTRLHLLRVGANYKFGGDPIVSAYASSAAAPVYNWTGFYAGLNVGRAWGRSQAMDVDCCGNGPWNAVGDTFTAKTSGVTGGIQAGYNRQFGMVVAGVEVDLGYLGFKGTQASSIAPDTFAVASGGLYGTVRGRLGLAYDRALFYATGGLIVADVRSGIEDPLYLLTGPFSGILFTEKTRTQAGWTLGGGVEYALLGNWSVKGEYLYFDLGQKRVVGLAANVDPPAYGYDVRNTGSIARFGVNTKL